MKTGLVESILLGASLAAVVAVAGRADRLAPLNSDSEPSRMD
jgi:hypothetical protein